jgi:hypothetical protein
MTVNLVSNGRIVRSLWMSELQHVNRVLVQKQLGLCVERRSSTRTETARLSGSAESAMRRIQRKSVFQS